MKLIDADKHRPASFDLLSSLFWPLSVGIHQVLNWLNPNGNIQCFGLAVFGQIQSLSLSPPSPEDTVIHANCMWTEFVPVANSFQCSTLIKLSWINLLFYVIFLDNHCFINSKCRFDQFELDWVGLISSRQNHKLLKTVTYHTNWSEDETIRRRWCRSPSCSYPPRLVLLSLFPKYLSLLNLANWCIKAITSGKYKHKSANCSWRDYTRWSDWQRATKSGSIFTGTLISLDVI